MERIKSCISKLVETSISSMPLKIFGIASFLVFLWRDLASLHSERKELATNSLPRLSWVIFCILQCFWNHVPWVMLISYFDYRKTEVDPHTNVSWWLFDEYGVYYKVKGILSWIWRERLYDKLFRQNDNNNNSIHESLLQIILKALLLIFTLAIGILLCVLFLLFWVPYIIFAKIVESNAWTIDRFDMIVKSTYILLIIWWVSNLAAIFILPPNLVADSWYINFLYGLLIIWFYFALILHLCYLKRYLMIFNPLLIIIEIIFALLGIVVFYSRLPSYFIILWFSNLISYCCFAPKRNLDIDRNYNDLSDDELSVQNSIDDTVKQKTLNQVECIICTDSIYLQDERKHAVLPCGHLFHLECIQDWIGTRGKNTCPIDRKVVSQEQILKIMI